MPDGKRIQDLNIDDVASIRRNPVICDLFSRLKLMERRGSGLRKIIDQYPEDSTPTFRSTEQSFIVTLKNLNYCRESTPSGDDNGNDNGDDNGVDNNVDLILNAIAENSKSTQKDIAAKTGLSTRTVSREIKSLRDSGAIRRIGSDRSGFWEII